MSRSWLATEIELVRFERDSDAAPWRQVGEPWPASLGAKGLGWGIGLHGRAPPQRLPGPMKSEGDRKSPAGLFSVGSAFGYADEPPAGTELAYLAVDGDWRCVDDPRSRLYNRVVSEKDVAEPDWTSAETMRRSDDLYRWGIFIDHNSLAVGHRAGGSARPGAGSCIFFHLWRERGGATVGCAAMARPEMEELLVWLDPGASPVVALLPNKEYKLLKTDWLLP